MNKPPATEVFTYTRAKGTHAVPRQRSRAEFEKTMLPHLAAAYNLARWLLRHPQDAEDAVQLAYLKAFKAFDQLSGDQSAAWLLSIVRNTCLTWLKKNASNAAVIHLDAVKSASEHRLIADLHKTLAEVPRYPGTRFQVPWPFK